MATLGQLIGAFIIIFLASRQAMVVLGKWYEGRRLIGAAHGATLVLAWFIAAFGGADKGVPDWSAGLIFVLPSLVWFLVAWFEQEESAASAVTIDPPANTHHTIRKGRDIPG